MDNNGYRLLLPEGTLDYFIISDVKESASEIVISDWSSDVCSSDLLFAQLKAELDEGKRIGNSDLFRRKE